MRKNPMISVAATTGLLACIAAAGGNPERVLRAVGLQRSRLEKMDGCIASSCFARLLEEAARSTGDECFGLHFGEQFDPKNLGALAYVVVNSPSLAAAIENVQRYIHIHNDGARVSFAMEGELGCLRYVLTDVAGDERRQHNEYSMAIAFRTFHGLLGDAWDAREVHFMHHAPASSSEHGRAFRCPVWFDRATNALIIERELLEKRLPAADPKLYRILKEYVERVAGELPRQEDLVGVVTQAVKAAMKQGPPKLAHVARNLSISPRTLERRLKAHQIVFKDLVNDTRRRLAIECLRDRSHTVTHVASSSAIRKRARSTVLSSAGPAPLLSNTVTS